MTWSILISFSLAKHRFVQIRTVEDLLTLTRALKESWLFGQLGEDSAQEKLDQGVVDENARAVFEWMKAKLREGDVGTPENTQLCLKIESTDVLSIVN